MVEGLLPGHMQGTTSRDRETHHAIHLLDGAAGLEPCLAVKDRKSTRLNSSHRL